MSILVYKDDACTQAIKTPQKFTVVTPSQVFTLTKMTGAEMGHLYKYNGTTHIKLIVGTDYTLSGNIITLAVALPTNNVLIAVPNDRLNLNFGGVFGATKTSTVPVVFKRETQFMYDTLMLTSENLDNTPFVQTYVDTAFDFTANQSMTNSANQSVVGTKCTSSVGGQLTGLTINALEGYALVLNNTYIGIIIANDVSSILVNNVGFVHVGNAVDDLSIFSIGTLLFALDVNGTVPNSGDFKPAITLPNLDDSKNTVKVWVKDTVVIPEVATNYPNMAFKLTGIEYLA